MTDNQVWKFLTRFGNPGDVAIIMRETGPGGIGLIGALSIAWKLWRKVPVAKIINKKWFYGMAFQTNRRTLDPRPDSETLVDAVLKNERPSRDGKAVRILDLGVGTGCLLCAIVKNFPNAVGVGIDKSRRACSVARANVKSSGLSDRIEIRRGTFADCDASGFDLIVSNPPYVAAFDFIDAGAKYDPKIALYGGKDGLKFFREIALIKTCAKLYVEIGAGQDSAVKEIFMSEGWKFISDYKDLSGHVRVLYFCLN
ncbi:MAG: peptide chain release factor N(5)-glutamine methyltransferase [Rickettsiales bacterium]|jgi:release factor glutamine methyltransferase|nr:peptide chain release factor N(5)-glutamine methyltransferase [Rickettsiales bacterium]